MTVHNQRKLYSAKWPITTIINKCGADGPGDLINQDIDMALVGRQVIYEYRIEGIIQIRQ